MKRATLVVLAMMIVLVLVPAMSFAQEAPAAQPKAAPTAAAAGLITYPAPEPLATAEEAKAEVEFMKPGDGMNLIVALLSMGAIGAIVVWGIVAQRRVSRAR